MRIAFSLIDVLDKGWKRWDAARTMLWNVPRHRPCDSVEDRMVSRLCKSILETWGLRDSADNYLVYF